jgi:peroxiredoxin
MHTPDWLGRVAPTATQLLVVALLAALLLVTLLTRTLREERSAHATTTQSTRHLIRGMYLPPLTADLLDGSQVSLADTTAGLQLLLLYNTTCHHCLASLPAWAELSALATEHEGIQVIGLSSHSRETTQGYSENHRLSFRSAVLDDDRYLALFRARLVPQVAIVDRGRVVYARLGRLESRVAIDSVASVIEALSAKSPERSEASLQ